MLLYQRRYSIITNMAIESSSGNPIQPSDFKLPIQYVNHNYLSDSTVNDLEILSTKPDNAEGQSLYHTMFAPTHPLHSLHSRDLMITYTTDVSFLNHTQTLIKDQISSIEHSSSEKALQMYDAFHLIHSEDDFHSKYQFIDIERFRFLNTNTSFMQMLSVYNMASPVITLITPIIILTLPFFLIRWQGVSLSLSTYFDIVKRLVKNHALGKIIGSFDSVPIEKRLYLMITAAFYLFQLYQSAISCYKFIYNMKHIHQTLDLTREYIQEYLSISQSLENCCQTLDTYTEFIAANQRTETTLRKLLYELDKVSELRISIAKASQIGHVMRLYYDIRFDPSYNQALVYSFHIHAFITELRHLSNMNLGTVEFTTKKQWRTEDMYYPQCIAVLPTKNTFDLNTPILLTGPNASGKTTLLKGALINTIISQQFGVGFYDKLTMKPYSMFHSYMDIPDTSGRDSLFQAEARRCLSIIDAVKEFGPDHSHFCVFDEIYSGTNPSEAIASAYAFIKHLSKQKNVTFVLTTHFYELCEITEKRKLRTKNKQMSFQTKDGHVHYTYKLRNNISNLKGGVSVLEKLGYDESILKDAKAILLRLR